MLCIAYDFGGRAVTLRLDRSTSRKEQAMRQYVLKRLLLVIPTLLLVSIIVFSLMRLISSSR